jgi:hypothetical protein
MNFSCRKFGDAECDANGENTELEETWRQKLDEERRGCRKAKMEYVTGERTPGQ